MGRVQALVLILGTAVGIFLCTWLTLPFLPAIAWALALAIVFMPLQRWLEAKWNRPALAASASVTLAALIVALPAFFVMQRLVTEASKGADVIKTKVESGEWRKSVEAQPRIAPAAAWIEKKIDVPGTVQNITGWVTTTTGSVVKGTVVQLITFCVTFYILFYLLRDRHEALEALRSLSPLSREEMDHLFVRVTDTIHATVYGTLAVSVVQGFLGGMMFWFLDLPSPLLWGGMMGLLAVVPVLGAFVVWVPAAVFLVINGALGKAVILAVWGTVVVGGIDNVMLPFLVGNRLKQHTILAFISLVGGLMVFGPAGIILGPAVLTITLVLLEIWRNRSAT